MEESISSVAHQVCEFANTIAAISSKSPTTENGNGGEMETLAVDESALGSLLTANRCYFSSELDTISFLKARAKSIQVQIPALSREIQECESLGMITNVVEMKKHEKEKRANMMDDNDLVEALIGEADAAKLTFMEQLGQFRSTSAFNSSKVDSYVATLRQIDEVFMRIGLPKDVKWTNTMTAYGCKMETANAGATTHSSPPAKKTGWNVAGAGGGLAKSLVDIQKEELGNGRA